MNKKPDALVYIVALGALIVVGIVTTSIINVVKTKEGSADIRAKAGTLNTLKLTGVVTSVDEAAGTIIVSDVQFDQTSRSGKAVNYGTWTVTPPNTFSISQAVPGIKIAFTISSTSFNVSSKQVAAVSVTVVQ